MVPVDPPLPAGDTRLILASASPRRRAFLAGAGVPVALRPVDLVEDPLPSEDPLACALRLAAAKARAGHERGPATGLDWSLGSDTVVTIDGRILGKPADADEALAMLRSLAGRTHEVITAWALAHRLGRVETGVSVTRVTFRPVSEVELAAYVATGDPLDKAGAYGIQSGAGAFVTAVEGSFDGVVGLPLAEVLDHLARLEVVQFPFGVAPRLARLRSAMAAAAVGAGRDPASVRLVGVSKGQPVPVLAEAVRLGQVVLGENYVQEWAGKQAALGPAVEWHFIGHLQRNKARAVGELAACVHSVDSVRLGEVLGRAAHAVGRVLPILIEVNQGGEASKAGVSVDAVAGLVAELAGIEGLAVQGLMSIPPASSPAEARGFFKQLRQLRDSLATPALPLPELSMGMSGDFREAIAEGATRVRVGTALFGSRG